MKYIFCFVSILFNTFLIKAQDKKIIYYPDTLGYFENYISLEKIDSFNINQNSFTKLFNPEKTSYILICKPDYKKPSPFYEAIFIPSDKGFNKVTFKDIASYETKYEWINNKLIFVRVWLGRIIALNLILDIEKESFIYKEVEDYFQTINPD